MRWLIALTLVLLFATPADAQDATSLFRRGALAFGAEHYEEAAALFAEAHALSGEPGMLYNLALARDRAGDAVHAIESYRAYLLASPSAPERAEIELRLATLEAEHRPDVSEPPDGALDPAIEPDARLAIDSGADSELASPPSLEHRDEGSSIAAVVVLSLGVAGLGVAGGLSAWAGDTHARAVAEPVQVLAVAHEAEALDLALAANLTWALAGTALITGVVWLVIDQLSTSAPARLAAGRVAIDF